MKQRRSNESRFRCEYLVQLGTRPLHAAVFFTILLSLMLAAAAHADCTTVTISPGAKVCHQDQFANTMICTSGTSLTQAKFQVYQGASTPVSTVNGTQIAGSGSPVSSFSANFDSFSDPSFFTGWFTICGINRSSTDDATITLCLHSDVSPCPAAGN